MGAQLGQLLLGLRQNSKTAQAVLQWPHGFELQCTESNMASLVVLWTAQARAACETNTAASAPSATLYAT